MARAGVLHDRDGTFADQRDRLWMG